MRRVLRDCITVELDLRSLAALRISLGFLVLLDLLLRSRDLQSFYTDEGLLPRIALLQIPHPTFASFHMAAESIWGVAFAFLLAAACALGVILGWHTRWCILATWLLHLSLKHRNPLILDAGDLELGLALWWALFLPVSARFSLDARRHPAWAELPNAYASIATAGYLLQLSLVYWMAAYNKSDPVWRESGLALYYCFNLDEFATPLARWLLQFPELLRVLTFLSLGLEALVPVLFWLPWKRKWGRGLGCLLLVLFHFSIAATLNLGMMVPINILATVGLWPWVAGRAGPSGPPVEVPPAYSLARGTRLFLLLNCLYIVFINYGNSVNLSVIAPGPVKIFGYLTQQQQDWPLFSPRPGEEDCWYVAQGECLNGQSIDLLRNGAPVDWSKPADVAATFPNQRWRTWLHNLNARRDPIVYQSFATWLAREWNRRHPGMESVKRVRLGMGVETTPPPGGRALVAPVILYDFACPESFYRKPNFVVL